LRTRVTYLIFFLFLAWSSQAQKCYPLYTSDYGGNGYDEGLGVSLTADGGSIVSGRTSTNSLGGFDGFLMRLTPSGTIVWSKNYGGSKDDELHKVVQTADGGFIAIGTTKSFGNPEGEPFFLKTDASGNQQWSRAYFNALPGRNRATAIIPLHSGGYAALVNLGDSTLQSDAVVFRIDAAGVLTWSRFFNNGKSDGFFALTESNDRLVVGGTSTVGLKNEGYGILTTLNASDGQLLYTSAIRDIRAMSNDITNCRVVLVESIPGGLAFSLEGATPGVFDGRPYMMTHFKRLYSGKNIYERRTTTNPGGGYYRMPLKGYYTPDNGFLQLVSDSAWSSLSNYTYWGPTGLLEHGKVLTDQAKFEKAKMNDMAVASASEYMSVGGIRKNWGLDLPEVRVIKLGKFGLSGQCSYADAMNFADTAIHTFEVFSWLESRSLPALQATVVDVMSLDNGFKQGDHCDDQYCEEQSNITDSCNSTYLVDVKSEDGMIRISEMIPAIEGGYIGGGEIFYPQHYEPLIVRLKPNGDIAWTVSLSKHINDGRIRKIIPTVDGHYLVVGVDYETIRNYGYERATLTKISGSGALIWSKEYDPGWMFKFHDVIPSGDGGYFAAGTGNYGGGRTYNFICRLAADGSFIWKRESHYGASTPVYKKLLLSGGSLYVGADFYLQGNFFLVEKWDGNAGNLVWGSRIDFSGAGRVIMKTLAKSGDSIYAVLSSNTTEGGLSQDLRTAVVRISDQGVLGGGYIVKSIAENPNVMTIWNREMTPLNILITKDNNIVFAQQASVGTQKGLVVQKFKLNGEGVFSLIYPTIQNKQVVSLRENADNILISGISDIPLIPKEPRIYSAFVMNTDANGQISTLPITSCSTVQAPIEILTLTGLRQINYDVDSISGARWFLQKDRAVYRRTVKALARLACNTPSNCYMLTIQGLDTLCGVSNTQRYTVIRNPGCSSPVLWTVDSSSVSVIARTDSTLDVTFKRTGRFTISARLSSGCTTLGDQKEIIFPTQIANFSLGKDTSICTGNQMLLNAGEGFVAYQWQDGSTDSVFRVDKAGLYFVRATDFCGLVKQDSIVVTETVLVSMQAGPDRQVCLGDTLQLQAPSGYANYVWKSSSLLQDQVQQGIVVQPSTDSKFIVTAEKSPGCFASDTIDIAVVKARSIVLGKDTSFCQGGSVLLDPGSSFLQYNWSNGTSNRVLEIKQAGVYHLMAVDANGCSARDTFEVKAVYPVPRVQLAKDLPLCEGKSISLSAPAGMQRYRWSDGSSGSALQVSQLGKYWVEITDNNGCKGSDTSSITKLLNTVHDFLPPDQAICSYDKLTVSPNRRFEQYQWSTNEVQASITLSKPGTYWVRVTDNYGCVSSDSITISYKECVKGFYVPNIFTPNNDGKNDRFKPLIYGRVVKYEIQVFNRFGERVFQSKDPLVSWDGSIAGQQNPVGTFTWLCVYQLDGEDLKQAKGTVTIVR
jgi:gliding motility-associated-like protein